MNITDVCLKNKNRSSCLKNGNYCLKKNLRILFELTFSFLFEEKQLRQNGLRSAFITHFNYIIIINFKNHYIINMMGCQA